MLGFEQIVWLLVHLYFIFTEWTLQKWRGLKKELRRAFEIHSLSCFSHSFHNVSPFQAYIRLWIVLYITTHLVH